MTTWHHTNHVLVSRSKRTTDLGWCRFCLVHGYGGTERADTQAADKTADGELLPRVEGGDLDDYTDHEDAALRGHGVPTTEVVGRSAHKR